MIDEIIEKVKNILECNEYKSVYSAFDNIPYYYKNDEISTFVGVSNFETQKPVYSIYTVFIPFKAVVAVDITASLDYSADSLFRFFNEYVIPKLNKSGYNIWEIKNLMIRPDTNLKRLVLRCEFNISGVFRKERQFAE